MKYAICFVSIMPMRISPDDRSEMVNQVLFGEMLEIIDEKDNWAYIRLAYDDYMGWVDCKQFVEISIDEQKRIENGELVLTSDLVQVLTCNRTKQLITLVLGSQLPNFKSKSISVNLDYFSFEGSIISNPQKLLRKNILENAMMYLNTPYLWGGKSPFGIDCSGFTQMVYKLSGIHLTRDAGQQVQQGDTINFITDALAGDLAFFDNPEGKIIHVGILLGDNKIIHSSGKVRIDAIDHHGIYHAEKGIYSHKLRVIKQFITKD
jgi:hypothetical protein